MRFEFKNASFKSELMITDYSNYEFIKQTHIALCMEV